MNSDDVLYRDSVITHQHANACRAWWCCGISVLSVTLWYCI